MKPDDQEEKERLEKENEKKKNIARVNFNLEKEENYKRSYTSFGKLILAEEHSNPLYSLGKANRFAVTGEMVTVSKDTPGPIYTPANEEAYKYRTSPRWAIGKGLRPPLNTLETFEYYKHGYEAKDDLSLKPKKWDKKVGGAMCLEPRIKYCFTEGTPGPGRYEPNYRVTRPRDLTYFMGEKTDSLSLKLLTGTNKHVGPGKYDIEKSKLTSVYTDFPKWNFGKEKRKGLFNKYWSKNETYEIYHSVGPQIRTHKRTEPTIGFGKANRDAEGKRGTFKQMMDRVPNRIRLPMPKF